MKTSSKKNRRFEEMVRALGCIVSGASTDVQVHHVKGRTYKHSKTLIGNVFILPLHRDFHMVSGHDNAYHRDKHRFIVSFGKPSDLFINIVLEQLIDLHGVEIAKFITPAQIEAIRTCPI